MLRWFPERDPQEALARLRYSVLSAIDSYMGTGGQLYDDLQFEQRFSMLHGSPVTRTSGLRQVILAATTREELALAVEHVLLALADLGTAYGAITVPADEVAKRIADAFRYNPFVGFRLVKVGTAYEVHHSGAEELDSAVVDRTLEWLSRFPAIRDEAAKALRLHAEGSYSDSMNASRVALEMLVRAAVSNEKSLENQIGNDPEASAPFLAWLRERGVKPQTVTIAQKIVRSICDLQNSWVKHIPVGGSSFEEAETEYVLYTSFALMRLVTRLMNV